MDSLVDTPFESFTNFGSYSLSWLSSGCGFMNQSAMLMPTALQALTILFVIAVLVTDCAEGWAHRLECPSFSCGSLRNVSFPFRQVGDPPGCGYQSYELVCNDTKATIRIYGATYYVSGINYADSTFLVIDTNLNSYNSCPLPRWNRPPDHPYSYSDDRIEVELAPAASNEACFVRCSQEVKYNSMYMPVSCMSTNVSFVYVLTGRHYYNYFGRILYAKPSSMENLESSCGYLAMTPRPQGGFELDNATYADVVKSMKNGFAVQFPFSYTRSRRGIKNFKECLSITQREFYGMGIKERPMSDFMDYLLFLDCLFGAVGLPPIAGLAGALATWILTWIAVLCRFVLAPLAVLVFLAHKYWKTGIAIDAVERFLRMQQMIGPMRYSYTDIVAITSHFRDKLGQGGYGSVYKGVLHPAHVHVAVKMLAGNSNCNGEDFISEVSTIGRIHHINVVRLVGFCSDEIRRALVYEYMPQGSLDKYIFSAEKIFSWDKLNEIALGIARGINYLHQGCEMQILHFDIKPHNILLDSNFIPKIADFGLAKLYPRDNSFVPLSALRGTVGYIAPEMISRSFGVISSKSDVYSFGMLLLEMAGGRRNAEPNVANSSQAYYPSWVYDRLTDQEVDEISVADDMHELEKKLCIVGLCCIQMKSQDRPTMSEVIDMLEAGAYGLQMPSRPFFCDEEHIHIEDSYCLTSELTAISEDDEQNMFMLI